MTLSRPLLTVLALAAVVLAAGSSSVSAKTASPLGGIPDKCVAMCPDGYMYATCTEDGHTINYFADPCLTHGGSSAPMNDCGANTVLCAKDRVPSCIEGKWRCVKGSAVSSTASSAVAPMTIKSFLPKYARIGKRVTLQGEGFAKNGNVVHIGDYVVRDVFSADGKTMTFLLPRIIKPACLYERPSCEIGLIRLEPGTYEVYVEKEGRKSNTMEMKVLELR